MRVARQCGSTPYADDHFLGELPHRFHARYWEMYLTVTVMDCGYDIAAPKLGPDFGVVVNQRRIWFEAVTATPEQAPALIEGRDSHSGRCRLYRMN